MRGASYAVDPLGIYFDATRASRFEELVSGRVLTEAERRRARSLRHRLRESGLTKYNLAGSAGVPIPEGEGEVILVPGQVADDAGVRRSLSDVIDCEREENVNLALLRLVRARNPSARIVYKPHPDVEAGLRKGAVAEADLAELVDGIARDTAFWKFCRLSTGSRPFRHWPVSRRFCGMCRLPFMECRSMPVGASLRT